MHNVFFNLVIFLENWFGFGHFPYWPYPPSPWLYLGIIDTFQIYMLKCLYFWIVQKHPFWKSSNLKILRTKGFPNLKYLYCHVPCSEFSLQGGHFDTFNSRFVYCKYYIGVGNSGIDVSEIVALFNTNLDHYVYVWCQFSSCENSLQPLTPRTINYLNKSTL